jgi:hypothetical protein
VALGVADGLAAVESGAKSSQDTLQFFSLKKQRDARVKGISFETFLEMKREGLFDQDYKVLNDTYL